MHKMFLPLREYADFKGCASREEFWSFFVLSGAVLAAMVVLTLLSDGVPSAGSQNQATPLWAIGYVVWWLTTAVPWYALQTRRLHDQGRTGWLALINLAGYVLVFTNPPLGLVLLAASMGLMALPGKSREDDYGARNDSQNEIDRSPIDELPTEGPQGIAMANYAGPEDHWADIEPGIKVGRDGQFYVRGYAYSALHQARLAATASPAKLPGKEAVARDDVVHTLDGRFTSGGYSFSTLKQAQSFAERQKMRHSGFVPSRSAPAAPAKVYGIGTSQRASPVAANKQKPSSGFFANRAKSPSSAARWIAGPERLEAGGVAFDAELLYFGSRTRDQRYTLHRALVDPTLPVGTDADRLGSTLGYWPNYSELQPVARRAYLEWLAGGRCDPNIPIGYVFIYFYGLEKRLIAEKAKDDAPAILAEARRLLALYGEQPSFNRYCTALIEAGEVIFESPPPPKASLDLRYGWEIPIAVRMHLGRKVRDGAPLDAEDALCWALSHPQLSTRTPVSRCFEEFRALWEHRFAEKFPGGLKVREPKARLQLQYRSASSEFSAHAAVDDMPDIGAIAGPIAKFDALLSGCADELDPLSRFLGRNPDERTSILAAALCPLPRGSPQ